MMRVMSKKGTEFEEIEVDLEKEKYLLEVEISIRVVVSEE